jgi:hypothetical protein
MDNAKQLVPKSIELFPAAVRINNTYHSIIKAGGYPRRVDDGWLQAFMSKNDRYDISIHVEPSSINETLVFLHNQIMRQTSDLVASTAKGTPNPSLEIKLADTKRLHDALYKGEEKLFKVSLYINNKAMEKKELNLLLEKCKANLNALLILPLQVKYNIIEGLISTMPIGVDALQEQREFPTSSLAATFPFLSTASAEKKGVLFAHEETSFNPIFIDFDSMSNKHFFIIGTSGSGKSYSAKYLIMQALFAENPRVYLLDPNAEYKDLCECLGGENIEISRESESSINIFDLAGEDLGSKLLGLLSAFDIIVGGLSESQKGALNEVLPAAYEAKGIYKEDKATWGKEPPVFTDIYRELDEFFERLRKRGPAGSRDMRRSVEVLMNRVGMYTQTGFFGFLDKQTKINLNGRVLNFDLSQLPAAVKPLMMFAVMDLISREIKRDREPKVFLIDEGWALLRSKEAENYLLDFIKTSRKYGASIGFITQEIEDLLGSEGGRSVVNLASTKILMKQSSANIGLIAKTLGLNQNERDFLVGCKRGHGLLVTELGHFKFFTKVSPKMHELITTDPREVSDPERKARVENMLKIKREMGEAQKEAAVPTQEDVLKGVDATRGLFLWKELSEGQRQALIILKGYHVRRTATFEPGGTRKFLVKPEGREGEVHAILKKLLEKELVKRGRSVKTYSSQKPDVVVENGGKGICFEIETGSNVDEELEKKFQDIKERYDECYIIVSDCRLRRRYEKYGKVATRGEVLGLLSKIFK